MAVKKTVKKSVKSSGKIHAGRPAGTGKYGVPTKVIRIPAHLEEDVVAFAQRKLKAESRT
jgi:hypothetical protein